MSVQTFSNMLVKTHPLVSTAATIVGGEMEGISKTAPKKDKKDKKEEEKNFFFFF